jgi:DNA-nicking Smr family endonuclease
MSRKRRNLTDAEQSLWDQVSQKIKPLPADKKRIVRAPTQFYPPARKERSLTIPPQGLTSLKNHNHKSDHRIQRIRKVQIDARLDLHGLKLEQARTRLGKFLITCQQNRCLWVLIITGKSKPKQLDEEPYHLPIKKTLREHVPQWLEEPFLHPVVSAYATAKPGDGGGGALYVRLKRLS